MANKKWSQERLNLVRVYLEQGIGYHRIAKSLGVGYDAVKHVVTRYNLKEGLDDDKLFEKTKGKLTNKDVHKLAKMIGESIYGDFTPVKLKESKCIKTKGKREEISILDISDVHIGMVNAFYDSELGKNVTTYNHDIFLKELKNLQDSIFQIHGILSNSYKLRKLVVFVLGDIITNDRIFPEQAFEIDSCVGQQVWKTIPAFAQFFNNLLKIYEKIEVVCVVGNHGRSNPTHYNEPCQNNFEYFIYKTWEKQFENSKRIKIIVPDTRRYVHTIGKWRHLVEHGDQLRGYTDTAIEKQLKEIYVNVGGFDVMHFGHLHKLKEREISDKVLVKQNGCFGEGTRILMGDFTYKNIEDIKIGEQIIGFKKARRGFELVKSKVLHTFTRKAKIGKLLFDDNRELNITLEHPIFAYEKKSHFSKSWIWKFPYENITTFPISKPVSNLRKTLPWKLGYLSGMLDGDGNLFKKGNRKVIHYYNNELYLIKYIKNLINNIIDETTVNKIMKDENNYSIQFGKLEKVNKFLTLIKKYENNEYFARGYLAGFYDAEGNFRTNQIRLFNTNIEYINKIKKYSKLLNIEYSEKCRQNKFTKYKDLTTMLLTPCYKFFEMCQPLLNRKKNMTTYNPTMSKTYYKTKKIKSVNFEYVEDKKTVFNLETDCHTYIAEGILVHNCWIYKDSYAWNKFKTYSIPKQHFFGCNDKRPETFSYKIDLRG